MVETNFLHHSIIKKFNILRLEAQHSNCTKILKFRKFKKFQSGIESRLIKLQFISSLGSNSKNIIIMAKI